ncbi:MAG TPA: class I SAM-dependent methyltransferase [Candidatus Limnocylindrales bacterium]|jgi:SAM-dependent methyltransferase|nr:class I SAM-dependent methyltransferase [Candidatus Limnocylindrales bacterium]
MTGPRDPAADDEALDLRDHEVRNRVAWNADADDYQSRHAAQLDVHGGLAWGVTQIPEAQLQVLGDVVGKDILEFGCGAAQWSIGLAKLGARPVALDLSERQLEYARRAMDVAGLDFPLIHASAEAVPLPDASFDIVFCDHGAMTFADPYRTVPEAARLLRRGGLFAFNQGSAFADVHWPADADAPGDRLVIDYFGLYRVELDDEVAFQLPYGEWIRLFRANGFVIEDLLEPRPAEDATSTYRDEATLAWSRRWPAESIWRLRKA